MLCVNNQPNRIVIHFVLLVHHFPYILLINFIHEILCSEVKYVYLALKFLTILDGNS